MFEELVVYHGGTDIIKSPKVDAGRVKLDFGPGFYITDIYSQAKDWALKIADNRNATPVVNIYHLKQRDLLSCCRYKIFKYYDREWLQFVTQSRLGHKPWAEYDYIEGGVADDRIVDTVRLFMSGFISADEAISRLKYFKPTNQICLLDQKLTDQYLSFVESKCL